MVDLEDKTGMDVDGFCEACVRKEVKQRRTVRRGEARVGSRVVAEEKKTECSDQKNINGIPVPEHSPRCTDAVFRPNVGFAVADGRTPQTAASSRSLAAHRPQL